MAAMLIKALTALVVLIAVPIALVWVTAKLPGLYPLFVGGAFRADLK